MERTNEIRCPICHRVFITGRLQPAGRVCSKECLAKLREKHGIGKQPKLF